MITTGRGRHDAGSRPSTVSPRGRQRSTGNGSRHGAACGSSRQAATIDDDEWEVDDPTKIPRKSTACERLTSTAPVDVRGRDVIQEQIDSGLLLVFIHSLVSGDNDNDDDDDVYFTLVTRTVK